MRLLLFGFLVFISSCCGGICVDVGPNYNLTEVAYDQGGALLYISGNMSLGYCEDCFEEVDKYGTSQLILDLNSLEFDVNIEKTKKRKTVKAPVEVPRVFSGSFSSSCRQCDLTMRTKDEAYTLVFMTDLEVIWERIQEHDVPGAAMLLSIYRGEELLAVFAFGYLSVDRVPEL